MVGDRAPDFTDTHEGGRHKTQTKNLSHFRCQGRSCRIVIRSSNLSLHGTGLRVGGVLVGFTSRRHRGNMTDTSGNGDTETRCREQTTPGHDGNITNTAR